MTSEQTLLKLLESVQMKHVVSVVPAGDKGHYDFVFAPPYLRDFTITVRVEVREEGSYTSAYIHSAIFEGGMDEHSIVDLESFEPQWIHDVPAFIVDFAPVDAYSMLDRLAESARLSLYQMNQGW